MSVIQAPNGTFQVLSQPGEKASNLLNIGSVEKIIRGKLFQGINVERIFQRLGADRQGNIGQEAFGKGLERMNVFLNDSKLSRLFRKYSSDGRTLNVKHFLTIVEGASTRDGGARVPQKRDGFAPAPAAATAAPSNRQSGGGGGGGGGFLDGFTASPPKARGRNSGPKTYDREHKQPRLPRMGLLEAVKVVVRKLQLCRDLRAVVRRYDVNRDGRLQKPEFNAVLEGAGLFLHKQDMTDVFEKFDPERDGITFQVSVCVSRVGLRGGGLLGGRRWRRCLFR